MIIDGRIMAKEMLARAKARAGGLPRSPRVVAIVCNETPATRSYLALKEKRAADAGCALETVRFPENTSTAALRAAVLSADADAIIVQLPLPAGVDIKEVCDAVPIEKDADVLSPLARTKFESVGKSDLPQPPPPVVGAIAEIFKKYAVDPKGKRAVVIGTGWLVGNPCAKWLAGQGAEVSVLTSPSDSLAASLRDADLIISGAGAPHLIKPEMLKKGVILIDAGTSESDGTIVGDADPSCAAECSLFTPVPGGIGPLAVAKLFENAITLAERAINS